MRSSCLPVEHPGSFGMGVAGIRLTILRGLTSMGLCGTARTGPSLADSGITCTTSPLALGGSDEVTGRTSLNRIALVVIGVLAAGFTAVGLTKAFASAGSAPGDGAPLQISPQRGAIPIIQGDPATVVDTLASGLPLVANARVITAPVPLSDEGPPTEANVLTYDLLVPSFGGSSITKALWEGNILAGAVADEYAARGFGSIADVQGTLVDPSGARQPVGGGIGNVVLDQVFNPVPDSLGAQVAASAAQFALLNVQVSKVQGLQDAAVIVATTDSPQATVDEFLHPSGVPPLETLLGGPPLQFEGTYFEVRDASGAPIYIAATAGRAGATTTWVDPSLGAAGNQLPTR